MVETTPTVKIDRSTFRRHPNAGETIISRRGPQVADVMVNFMNGSTHYRTTGPVEYQKGRRGKLWATGVALKIATEVRLSMLGGRQPAARNPMAVCEEPKRFRCRVGHTVRRTFQVSFPYACRDHLLTPFPNWIFEYLPPDFFVECRACHAQFKATKLKTIDDPADEEPSMYNCCPKCETPDCVRLAYEKPEDVAREMGLAKV